jgi:hypothetical protein
MKTLIIIIATYLLSVYLMWRYIRIAHSKDGIWSFTYPDRTDLFITFFPFLNTLAVLMGYISFPPREKNNRNFSKFFKIKK